MEQRPYKRKIFIINKKFQIKYTAVMLTMMIVTVLTVAFTTFYIIWENVLNAFMRTPEAQQKLGTILAQTMQILTIPVIILGIIFSVVGILYSHRIAGPIYRVQKVSEELAKGNLNIEVYFRKGDELPELALAMNKVILGLRGLVKDDNRIKEKLIKLTARLKSDIKKEKKLKPDVKKTIAELDRIIIELKKTSAKFKV